MFDIGWSELVVIGVVALIAIGPKELPGVLRMVGQWMGKARRMASEFQGQFNEAMREAELDELRRDRAISMLEDGTVPIERVAAELFEAPAFKHGQLAYTRGEQFKVFAARQQAGGDVEHAVLVEVAAAHSLRPVAGVERRHPRPERRHALATQEQADGSRTRPDSGQVCA